MTPATLERPAGHDTDEDEPDGICHILIDSEVDPERTVCGAKPRSGHGVHNRRVCRAEGHTTCPDCTRLDSYTV